MKKFLIASLLLACLHCFNFQDANGQTNSATPVSNSVNPAYAKDVSSESNIIAALYDVISGEAGEARNWERFKYLFGKDALLIPTTKSPTGVISYRTMTPDDYITMFSSRIKTGFFEKELKHVRNSYGTIANIFSTYETRETKNGPITNRGINSVQLFYDQNRYYIVNVFWCAESMGFALPSAYLK
ncbi:MAG: hypothetical protein RLZZ391_314 [Bacteroidota bacterium]|jgi:hypothetical protein